MGALSRMSIQEAQELWWPNLSRSQVVLEVEKASIRAWSRIPSEVQKLPDLRGKAVRAGAKLAGAGDILGLLDSQKSEWFTLAVLSRMKLFAHCARSRRKANEVAARFTQ